jgi:hypothetical protein
MNYHLNQFNLHKKMKALAITTAAILLLFSNIARSQISDGIMEFEVFKKNLLTLNGKNIQIYAGLEKPRACTSPSFEKYYCLELTNNKLKEVALIEKSRKNIRELIKLADDRLPMAVQGRVISTTYKATTLSGLVETTDPILYVDTIEAAPANAVILTPMFVKWNSILTNASGMRLSYNQEEIFGGGGYLSIWLNNDLATPKKYEDGKNYTKTIARHIFDCKKLVSTRKSIVFYSSGGASLGSDTSEFKESFTMNDGKEASIIFNKLKELC